MNRGVAMAAAVGAVVGAVWWIRSGGSIGGEGDNAPSLLEMGAAAVDGAQTIFGSGDMNAQQNTRAFLNGLRYGEGTAGTYGYSTLYGGGQFGSYVDHPALLGWPGGKLSDAQCKGAGFGPGCVSTAAGAYQINRSTWLRLKSKLNLQDFTPGSQDAAAIELISERGALADVQAGRIALAISKVKKIWASLPGAGYGQREVAMESFSNEYVKNGGTVA